MSKRTTEDWRKRARQLHRYGVPEQRANVVALREQGYSYSEIATELQFGSNNQDRSQVAHHLNAYREWREKAAWLLEHGPDI